MTTAYSYELAVQRDFIAQHVLTVPDPEPPEGQIHSHHFEVELHFAGDSLGEYGYLLNIVTVESILEDLVERYRDSVLNDLPEFEGLNPSVENFSRIFGDHVAERLSAAGETTPDQLQVQIWEDDAAWASHTRTV